MLTTNDLPPELAFQAPTTPPLRLLEQRDGDGDVPRRLLERPKLRRNALPRNLLDCRVVRAPSGVFPVAIYA